MKLRLKGKILLLALAVCIVSSIVTAETLIAIDLLHDCKSPDCRPCLRIETLERFLSAFRMASITFSPIGSLAFYSETIQKHAEFYIYTLSPIVMKVRLNS
jgi:hypothetical protein